VVLVLVDICLANEELKIWTSLLGMRHWLLLTVLVCPFEEVIRGISGVQVEAGYYALLMF
jgi:hypothetical protein